jgi:hypothetical protein
MEIARIGGNVIYESILKTIHDNIDRYFESFLPRELRTAKVSYSEMLHLVNAIEKGNSRTALSIAQKHVRKGHAFMEEVFRRQSASLQANIEDGYDKKSVSDFSLSIRRTVPRVRDPGVPGHNRGSQRWGT